ncbi:hypothetical protein PIB30_088684 [Stylosanthes scabra]|uniref:Uncharacterized protein n=1 Tax=Stylosanthes scabra TaxID=79078 RepID=A0ABU6QT91_9FABA|nr:hypothetical protein [Stylosanthes scabra]
MELSSLISNKENSPKLLTNLLKTLLILRIKEKVQNEAWKARKQRNRESRATRAKTEHPRLGATTHA